MVLGHVHCSHLDDVAIARINLAKFAAISKEGVLYESARSEIFVNRERHRERRARTTPALRSRPHIASLSQNRRKMLRVRRSLWTFPD